MWHGSLHLTDDAVVLIGRGRSHADAHAHYAAQLTFAWDGSLVIDSGGAKLRGHSIVPSAQRHRIEVDAERIVMVMAEPWTPFGHAIDSAARSLDPWEISRRLGSLQPPASHEGVPELLSHVARVVAADAPAATPRRSVHVANALRYVQTSAASDLSLAGAATAAGVSRSRLTHLFSTEMGIAFSRYVLWSRFRRVVPEMARGATLTHAAAVAGFSDGAHLSRSFRRAFGIAPSALAGVELHVS